MLGMVPVLLQGCKTEPVDDSGLFPKEVSFEISDLLHTGKAVKALWVRDEKNYSFAAGNEVFLFHNGMESHYKLSSEVLGLAWKELDNTLWAGTSASGLARISNDVVTYYTKASHSLPRDLVSHVDCDSNGRIWFSSSAHQLGGAGAAAH